MVTRQLIFLVMILFIPFSFLYAETITLRTEAADIIYEDSLSAVTREVAKAYPSVKSELAQTLQWQVDFRPNIVLAKDSEQFRKFAGSNIIVAYAVPGKNLIVLEILQGSMPNRFHLRRLLNMSCATCFCTVI